MAGGTAGSVGPCRRESNERANEGELIKHRRHTGHQFGDLDARNIGGDRLELAADLRGSIRLEIDHIQVGRPSRQIDHDHRLVRTADPGPILRTQQLRQRQAAQPQSTDRKKTAPRHPAKYPRRVSSKSEHTSVISQIRDGNRPESPGPSPQPPRTTGRIRLPQSDLSLNVTVPETRVCASAHQCQRRGRGTSGRLPPDRACCPA